MGARSVLIIPSEGKTVNILCIHWRTWHHMFARQGEKKSAFDRPIGQGLTYVVVTWGSSQVRIEIPIELGPWSRGGSMFERHGAHFGQSPQVGIKILIELNGALEYVSHV